MDEHTMIPCDNRHQIAEEPAIGKFVQAVQLMHRLLIAIERRLAIHPVNIDVDSPHQSAAWARSPDTPVNLRCAAIVSKLMTRTCPNTDNDRNNKVEGAYMSSSEARHTWRVISKASSRSISPTRLVPTRRVLTEWMCTSLSSCRTCSTDCGCTAKSKI